MNTGFRLRRTASVAFGWTAFAWLLLLVGGCPPSGQDGNDPNDGNEPDDGNDANTVVTVHMSGTAFSPHAVTIRTGQTVRWENDDVVAHTTTSGSPGEVGAGSEWESGLLSRGASFSRQFDTAGEFIYFCRVHPLQMRNARVTVTE